MTRLLMLLWCLSSFCIPLNFTYILVFKVIMYIKYMQSNTGQNLDYLLQKYNCKTLEELINKKQSIKVNRGNPLLDDEGWKPSFINEICSIKMGYLEADIDEKILDDILTNLCCNWVANYCVHSYWPLWLWIALQYWSLNFYHL